ncbi:MAG: phosphohistidine phosphatase SixA [Planctomycetota bacterium]
MIVYLLRHGNAEDFAAAGGDDARELTAEGRERLQRAGACWRKLVGPVDLVLSSPLVRARQTAALFVEAACPQARVEEERSLEPSARPLLMLERLQACAVQGLTGVACVGHEPHMGNLLGLLLTGHERSPIPFKKGMLAVVEVEGSSHMIGRLVAAISQKTAATF